MGNRNMRRSVNNFRILQLFTKMINSMKRLTEEIGENGSKSFSTPLWDSNNVSINSTIVLHNCSMGKDRNHGVVDNFGRVYKGDGICFN